MPAQRIWTTLGRYARFALHFGEMWIAMLIGMMVYHGLTGQGHGASTDTVSLANQLGMMVSMTVPMVVWMRLRGHGWRHGAEMSIWMVVPALAIAGLIQLGAAESMPWLRAADHPAMGLGMLGAMLLRRDHYTGSHMLPPRSFAPARNTPVAAE